VGKNRAVNLNGVSNAILGDWTVNGIFYWSSGIPVASPMVGQSPNPNAQTIYVNQRADMICDPSKGAPHTITQWFTADCFAVPGTEATGNPADANPFIPGTAPSYLDHVRTMGARDLDLSLYKRLSFGENRELRFEVSSYNVTNTAQLGMPNVPSMADFQAGVQSFSQITTTVNTPRQFQFGARFTF
jgi:hypothetical protein